MADSRRLAAMQWLVPALVALALNLLTQPSWASSKSFRALVVSVSDGDTVTALINNSTLRVRLANIDAPESGHGRCRPSQPWSTQSKNYLTNLVKQRLATFNCTDVDRYGRHICDIDLDGLSINREMVRNGLAWANRAHPRYLRDPQVALAELQAQSSQAGLWQDRSAVEPWLWRKFHWNTAASCDKGSLQ